MTSHPGFGAQRYCIPLRWMRDPVSCGQTSASHPPKRLAFCGCRLLSGAYPLHCLQLPNQDLRFCRGENILMPAAL